MKFLSVLVISIFCMFTTFAQSGGSPKLTDNEISELSSKLAMKLLMNDSQKSGINEILKTYSSELTKINSGSGESKYKSKQELISSLDSKIKSLLDTKQKMKFDVLEKEWWSSVDEKAGD